MDSISTARSQDAIELKRRLRRELRWLRARWIGHAAVMLLGGGGVLLAVAVLASPSWNRLGPWGAWLVWLGLLFAFAWLAIFEVVLPLRRLANLKGFSRELELHGDYRNLLEAATQFTSPRKQDPLRFGASSELVAEILRRARAEVARTTLSPRIPLPGALPHVLIVILAAGVWLGLARWAPDRVGLGFAALAEPNALAAVQAREGLFALNGDLRVAIGGSAQLRARDFSAGDEAIALLVNRGGDFWEEIPTQDKVVPLFPPPYREAAAELDGIQDPLRYRFRKGQLLSSIHSIAVRQRPVLRELSAVFTPPAYTARPAESQAELGGVVRLLVGTEVRLAGRATSELSRAQRLPESGTAKDLKVLGEAFADSFVLEADLSFRLLLADSEGLESEARTVYRFVAEPDEAPTIELSQPTADVTLERDLRVAVRAQAADDVGIARVTLLYRNEEESDWRHIVLHRKNGSVDKRVDIENLAVESTQHEVALGFVWNLADESLFPGDTMLFCLQVTDNNDRVGGQTARSETIRLRLPTVGEAFAEERQERDAEQGELSSILEEGEELRETLERLDRELKKNPEPDWAKQQEIQDALERQEALKEKLDEAANRMQQQLDEFAKQNAGSMELMQKMQTIQELLEQIENEDLQSYIDAMKEAMDQLLPHEVQRAMEDALANQEEYNRRLDRTIELLRQLERERAMSDLVEEVADHLERQEDLIEETSDEQKSGSQDEQSGSEKPNEAEPTPTDDELARAQEKLSEDVRALEERLREKLEELQKQQEQGEASDQSAEEMKESLEEAQESMQQDGKPSEAMDRSADQLENENRSEAQKQQEEARKRLLFLYETLQQGQQAMQMASMEYAADKLQQTAFDLLQLSFGEEGIVDGLGEGVQGQRLSPLTREQGRIHRAGAKLSQDLHDLARQNFMIPEPLLAQFRGLVELLEDCVDELQLSRAQRSRVAATQAMGQMNKIVMGLLTTAMSQGQGSGSGQNGSISQQMQQMSEDQSRLNGMTEQLRRSMEQGLSEEERRQLAQMHGQQEALRRQLDDIRKQLGDERRVLGDMDELQREMKEVVDGLEAGRLDESTQRQQEKILSRMLDAQRSIRERDFAKERESREAQGLFGLQEGPLAAGDPQLQQQLRRWLAPEKAPDAYEDEVRRYFRRIQEQLQEGGGR